jgi:rhamnosyltransferase
VPKVLVLLALFDPDESHLSVQLASIISQLNCSVSIAIGDDSPSGPISKDRLTRICPQLDRHLVTITNGPRSGFPSTNFLNLLGSCATSDYDYIAFSDQDDIWLPGKLRSAISRLTIYEGPACYSSELIVWTQESSSFKITSLHSMRSPMYGLMFARGAGCTLVLNSQGATALAAHIRYLFDLGLEKTIYSHDMFISSFFASRGFDWFHDIKSHVMYRQHSGNNWGINRILTIHGLLSRYKFMVRNCHSSTLAASFLLCDNPAFAGLGIDPANGSYCTPKFLFRMHRVVPFLSVKYIMLFIAVSLLLVRRLLVKLRLLLSAAI